MIKDSSSEENSDIIGGEREEGICVCGEHMRKVSKHLNYIVWKCEFCGRKDARWKGARPFELNNTEKRETVGSSILDDIITVLDEEEKKR